MAEVVGADLVGFIFFQKSPRYVSPERVSRIKTQTARRVGVFVDTPLEEIEEMISVARLDFVQLHGDFSPKECKELGPSRVIKVLWPEVYLHEEDFFNDIERYLSCCRYLLFDAGRQGGGYGRNISNLSLLERVSESVPWIMAGGISLENIEWLMSVVSPRGWDINSSVESYPGKKDHNKLIKLVKKIKELR